MIADYQRYKEFAAEWYWSLFVSVNEPKWRDRAVPCPHQLLSRQNTRHFGAIDYVLLQTAGIWVFHWTPNPEHQPRRLLAIQSRHFSRQSVARQVYNPEDTRNREKHTKSRLIRQKSGHFGRIVCFYSASQARRAINPTLGVRIPLFQKTCKRYPDRNPDIMSG